MYLHVTTITDLISTTNGSINIKITKSTNRKCYISQHTNSSPYDLLKLQTANYSFKLLQHLYPNQKFIRNTILCSNMEISNIIPNPKSIPAFCKKKYPQRLHPWSLASLCSISGTLKKKEQPLGFQNHRLVFRRICNTALYVAGYIMSQFSKT